MRTNMLIGIGSCLMMSLSTEVAATIWVVAGVGLLVGGGYYATGLLATAVILFTLLVFGQLGIGLQKYGSRDTVFYITAINKEGVVEEIYRIVDECGGSLQNRYIEKRDWQLHMTFSTWTFNACWRAHRLQKCYRGKGGLARFGQNLMYISSIVNLARKQCKSSLIWICEHCF